MMPTNEKQGRLPAAWNGKSAAAGSAGGGARGKTGSGGQCYLALK